MGSARASAVAEVLWELKRVDKVARFSVIGARAGFNSGSNGRAMKVCLDAIRKEWPHLQSWRAIPDDGAVDVQSQQAKDLKAWGVTIQGQDNGRGDIQLDDSRVMDWTENKAPVAASDAE